MDDPTVRAEPRWPMAAAVIVASSLTLARPAELRLAPWWVLPGVEAVLLIVLIVRDPGRIDRRTRALRAVSIGAVGLLVLDALLATGYMVVILIQGGKLTDSADALLTAGGVVWASNVIAFALLYWELDSGGSAVRAHGLPSSPDIAFPQQLNPELAPRGWRPQFHDYLFLGLMSALAFSPTDAMPLKGWVKLAMSVEALISLVVLGLVVARAVNVLT